MKYQSVIFCGAFYMHWPLTYGIDMKVQHGIKKLSKYPAIQNVAGVIITLNFVMLSFVLISENSLSQSFNLLQTLLFLKR